MNAFQNINRANGKSGPCEILKSARLLQLHENEFLPSFLIIQSRKSDAEKRFNPGKGRESQILTLNSATDCLLGKRQKSPIRSWRVKISGTSEESRSECKSSFPTFWVHYMLYNYLSSNFITQTASIWRLNSINMYKDLIQCLPHSRDQYLLVSLSLEQNKKLSLCIYMINRYLCIGR